MTFSPRDLTNDFEDENGRIIPYAQPCRDILVLMIAVLIGVLALISAGYCFWLMNVPLSYRWVPAVITGFLLAISVFIISLITSFIALMQLRRQLRPRNTPQIRPPA